MALEKMVVVGRGMNDQFPAGLRVLLVDDDITCLKLLEHMLRKCLYQVTPCCQAKRALTLLREEKGAFDLVISDVHMPDMDGFEFLELVGLEMDLPVIMMSADGRTNAVMTGIKHGACDYLIKPVRMEELKNVWQHVVRKRWNDNKEYENSGSLEETDRQKRGIGDTEHASSVNDGTDSSWKGQKKKREFKENDEDGELDNEDPSSKKPRVVWSRELHQQFLSAVHKLGTDKAVPKKILESMNVPGLTRENVASHLQKYRLCLKKHSGDTQQQGAPHNFYCGLIESTPKVNPLGRFDFQALASSGQILPQTLAAALHSDLLGRPSSNMVFPVLEQPDLLQTSIPEPKFIPVEHGVEYCQPSVKCHSNLAKQFSQSNVVMEGAASGFSDWSPNNLGASCSTNNLTERGISSSLQCNNVLLEYSQEVNVQPSCLIVPSQSSSTYQFRNNPTPITPNPYHVGSSVTHINQNSFANSDTIIDYSLISSQALGGRQTADEHFKSSGLLNGAYSFAGSMPSLMSSRGVSSNLVLNTNHSSGRLSGLAVNLDDDPQSCGIINRVPSQGEVKNVGFVVGKDGCIPTRFAVDDMRPSPTGLDGKL